MIMKQFVSMILVLVLVISMLPTMSLSAVASVWDPFNGDQEVNIVYLGESTTAASGWRVPVGNYMKQTYEGLVPGRKINNYNAGIGGTASDYGFIRLERDVISKNPDMVFVEFAINDGSAEDASAAKTARITNSMEGIVRRLQSLPNPPIIVFVYCSNSTFKNSYEIHSKVAKYYNIPEIDFVKHMMDLGYVGAEKGTAYDKLPLKLKSIYGDATHPNEAGYKIWADYAVSELAKNPQKYFRHPELRQNPLSIDHLGEISAKYITAEEALENGALSVINKDGSSGVQGSDYEIESDGAIRISGIGNKAVLNFEGRVISLVVKVNAADSTIFTYDLDNGFIKDTGSCFYGGEDSFVETNLKEGSHKLVVTVSEPRPAGSSADNIRIKGFFIDSGSKVSYPVSYAEGVKINVWDGSEPDKKGDKDQEQVKESPYKAEIDFVTQLGIMSKDEEGNFNAEAEVTRAQLASILSVLFRLGEENDEERWYSAFYKSDDNDVVKHPPTVKEDRFADVDSEHPAARDIEAVVGIGLMSGVSENAFEPDRAVSLSEVAAVFIKALGYKVKADLYGGYPTGYITVANQLKLFKGLSLPTNHIVKAGEMAKIIVNSTDVELLQIMNVGDDVGYKTYKGETLLTKVMGLEKSSGLITDNGITSLTGKSNLRKNQVKIENTIYALSEKALYVKSFIGRHVDFYYTNSEGEDIHNIVYAALSGDDDAITFDIQDFVSLSVGSLEYMEKDDIRSVSLHSVPYMIFNGLAIKSFDQNHFNFDNGDVTLVSSNGSNQYDIIIVNGYRTWVVGEVDSKNYRVYNKAANRNASPDDLVFSADPKDEEIDVTILDSSLESAKFEDIKKGSILDVSRNGNVVRAIISTKKVAAFKVNEISDDAEGRVIIGDKEQYKISNDYLNFSGSIDIQIGNTYTVYLNNFGKVGWMELEAVTDLVPAYLLKAARAGNGISAKIQLKLLTNKGTIVVMDTADKITLEDQDGNKNTYDNHDSRLTGTITRYSGIIRYKLNNNKEVSYLELPLTTNVDSRGEGRLAMYQAISGVASVYISPAQQFGGKVQINDNTLIFLVNPLEPDENRKCKIIQRASLIDRREYLGTAYNTMADSPYAEFVVLETDSTDVSLNRATNKTYVVVTNVVKSINFDGEQGTKVYGFQITSNSAASYVELFSRDDKVDQYGVKCSAFEIAGDGVASGNTYKVEKGDIIRYYAEHDNVEQVEIMYKASAENPAFPNGHKGNLAGTSGCLDNTTGKTNPFVINSHQDLMKAEQEYFNEGELRMIYGSIYAIYPNNILKYTTQDLSIASYDPNDSRFLTESIKIPNVFVTITYKNGNVEAGLGSISDIRTYKDAGKDCSRIIVQTRSGRIERVFVINGDIQGPF